MIIDNEDLTNEELIHALEFALVDALDIHQSMIDISFDAETSIASYIISSDDISAVTDAIERMSNEDVTSSIDFGEDFSIESIETSNDIIATIGVVVDASSTADADSAIVAASESIQNQDHSYQITAQCNLIKEDFQKNFQSF